MSEYPDELFQTAANDKTQLPNAEVRNWFSVSGDLDDFIFFEQTDKLQSER